MDIRYILVVLILASSSIVGANERTESCLEKEWQELLPDEAEKTFDRKNDFDRDGNHFSCAVQLTPSEIKKFLDKINNALNVNDRKEVSNLFRFPFNVSFKKYRGKIRDKKTKVVSVESEEKLLELFEQIFNPDIKRTLQCSRFTNMMANPKGIALNLGQIWLDKNRDDRSIHIRYLSVNFPQKVLFNDKCEKSKIQKSKGSM